jgi:peptide/nickel transport system permease protein
MAQTAATVNPVIVEKKRLPFLVEILVRLVKEKPLGTFGGVIVVILFLVGIFANFLAPYGYNEMVLGARLQAPSTTYWLGTDNLGRDLLSRIIYGARISMIVGLAVPAISITLNCILGIVSGYVGGWVDLAIQRFVDTVMCFPGLVIMLTVVAITGPGLIQVILLLGILGGIGGGVRVNRSAVLGVKTNVYIEASRAVGCSTPRIMWKHIMPNIMPVVIIGFTMGMGGAILAEATLSFLGFGIPPPAPSWGGMLSGPARRYMLQAPWKALWPGVALSLVVYGMNMMGDGLRDILDPRLRGGLGRYGRKTKKVEAT